MSRYRSHTWVVNGVKETGFGILYDTGEIGPGVYEPKGLRAKPCLVLQRPGVVEGRKGTELIRYATFNDEDTAKGFQRFIDSVIDAGNNKAVDAIGAIEQVGKGLAEHLIEGARRMGLSPQQYEVFEEMIKGFQGIGEAIKKITGEGLPQT